MDKTPDHVAIAKYLDCARSLGFLGPGELEQHVAIARRFLRCLPRESVRALDLGSGAGIPGILLALWRPKDTWVLLDAMEKRCSFLREVIDRFDMHDRVNVCIGRAEEKAHETDMRGKFDVVTARGFGSAGTTAECAAGFLRVGGILIVSEPTESSERWENDGLRSLGVQSVPSNEPFMFMGKTEHLCPNNFPRRNGIPKKRPLF